MLHRRREFGGFKAVHVGRERGPTPFFKSVTEIPGMIGPIGLRRDDSRPGTSMAKTGPPDHIIIKSMCTNGVARGRNDRLRVEP